MHNSDDETFFCVGIFIIHFRPTSQGGQGRKEEGRSVPKRREGRGHCLPPSEGEKREEKVDIVWDMGRMGGGKERKGAKEERAFPGPPPYFLYYRYYYFLHHRTSSYFPFTLSLSPATHALKSHKRMWRKGGGGEEMDLVTRSDCMRPCPFGIRCQHTRSEGECYIFVPSFPPKKHCRLISSFK